MRWILSLLCVVAASVPGVAQDGPAGETAAIYTRDGIDLLLDGEADGFPGVLSQPLFAPETTPAFAFVREQDGNSDLYIFDLRNSDVVQISPGAPFGDAPVAAAGIQYNEQLAWRPIPDSRGRQWFAFVSNWEDGNLDVYLGYLGTEEYVRLTRDPAPDASPRWSPDGRSLAFISQRSGDGDIYLAEDLDGIIQKGRPGTSASIRPLLQTPEAEAGLAWNPDPAARLLAYTQRVAFPGRDVQTFQIRVLDVSRRADNNLVVTDDPLAHYTRPIWDPHSANRLLYVKQSVVQDVSADLYITEFRWVDGRLENAVLEGYQTPVFNRVWVGGHNLEWLRGGVSILCQRDDPTGDLPLYSVNVNKWLGKEEGAVVPFEELSGMYPGITEFDVGNDQLVFVTRTGDRYRLFLTNIDGENVAPFATPNYILAKPDRAPLSGVNRYVVAGSAVAAGVVAYFLLSGDESASPEPIGRPPGLPR